jgi:hypothetical protein
MMIQISDHTIIHPFQMIRGLYKDAIVGIDFINTHKVIHDPKRGQFSWGSRPKWYCSQILKSKATSLEPGATSTVQIDLLT